MPEAITVKTVCTRSYREGGSFILKVMYSGSTVSAWKGELYSAEYEELNLALVLDDRDHINHLKKVTGTWHLPDPLHTILVL